MSKELYESLKVLVKAFLDREIDRLEIELGGLDINENELKELAGNYDSSNREVHDDWIADEYTYNVSPKVSPNICVKFMRKLSLVYRIHDIRNRNYILYDVRGFVDKTHVECNEP